MNPRNIYLSFAAGFAAVILVFAGVVVWRRRFEIKAKLGTGKAKVRGMARSWYGRVANASDRVIHTERDPQYRTPDTST